MSKRRIFETHGVTFSGENGDQLIGYCPFSDRDNKFYVNQRTWLWDSKTAGLSGNIASFLKLTMARYRKGMTPARLTALARNRQLPEEAFKTLHLGFTGTQYAIPIADNTGALVDIRLYRLNGKVISTAGVNVGLFGAHQLAFAPDIPVYICEGEWDTIALAWILSASKQHGFAVGLPGAGTFKPEWAMWLSGRVVHTLYDNDGSGEAGEHTALARLKTSVQKLTFIHWPSDLPSGFDVRDWVVRHTKDQVRPERILSKLHLLFHPVPRVKELGKPAYPTLEEANRNRHAPTDPKSTTPQTKWTTKPTLQDVMKVFQKWLHLDNTDGIRIMLACVASQIMDGPPVWVFLVGPPGSAKTAILASLNEYEKIYSTSSLTVHALISGANWKETVDPSLIPKLNGKIMVVKDFTSILSMRDAEKDEIFGILRDAFDGRCGKVFGNGVERHYISRFTILAAVTPRIYDLSSNHTSLGERFLKFSVGHNLVHASEEEIIAKAIGNINSEAQMNTEFQDVVTQYLIRSVSHDRIPKVSQAIEKKIIALAMWGARMRGSVTRDAYKNEIITSRPSAEIGSRLGIQLAKLGKALAMIGQRNEVSEDDYRLLKKVTLDTIPQRNEDVFRHMLDLCPTDAESISAAHIASITRYPVATIQRLLQDMDVLDIVTKSGTQMKYFWTLSPYIRKCATRAGLYQTEEERSRPTRVWVKRKTKIA